MVPRVVQKIYDGVFAKIAKMNAIKKYLFNACYAIRLRCY